MDPTGTTNSVAYAVNSSGQAVGSKLDSTGLDRPFLWPTAAGMKDLGTLGGDRGVAFGINAAGQVVGEAKNSDQITRAFLWTAAKGMKDLGYLGGYYKESTARGINKNGWVVGNSDSDNGYHAFLWTQLGGMIDLNSVTSPIPPGDYLDLAKAINDSGRIVGQTGKGRAFLLEPLY